MKAMGQGSETPFRFVASLTEGLARLSRASHNRTLRSVGTGVRDRPGHPVAARKGGPYRDLSSEDSKEVR